MQGVIDGLALQPPPLSIAALYRQGTRFAQDRNEGSRGYSRIYDIVWCRLQDLMTLAHQGRKIYGDTFDLIRRLDPIMRRWPAIRHFTHASGS